MRGPLLGAFLIAFTVEVCFALPLQKKTVRKKAPDDLKIVFGIHTSRNEEKYGVKLRAQFKTWASEISPDRMFVSGPICESPLCDEDAPGRLWTPTTCVDDVKFCKVVNYLARAYQALPEIGFDWLFGMNEDQYINFAELRQALARFDPDEPVVFSGMGCGRLWRYDPRSENGTIPKPENYVEHTGDQEATCQHLNKFGGICGGGGIAYSRAALRKLFANGEPHWDMFPPRTQCDPAITCMLAAKDITMQEKPWKAGGKSDNLDSRAAVYHIVAGQNGTEAADRMRELYAQLLAWRRAEAEVSK